MFLTEQQATKKAAEAGRWKLIKIESLSLGLPAKHSVHENI